jgi:hypothetical protein
MPYRKTDDLRQPRARFRTNRTVAACLLAAAMLIAGMPPVISQEPPFPFPFPFPFPPVILPPPAGVPPPPHPPGLAPPPPPVAPPPIFAPPPVLAPPPPAIVLPLPGPTPPASQWPVPTISGPNIVETVATGRRVCRRGDHSRGRDIWRSAQTHWNALDRSGRQRVARDLVKRQLGRIPFGDDVDPRITNIARVTGTGNVVQLSYSGNFTPPGYQPAYQTPLDMPLTIPPRIAGFPYATFLHFLCYEAEVMRIRAEIAGRCAAVGRQIAPQITALRAPVDQARYDGFMAGFAGADRVTRLAASWMFERIVAEPDAYADGSCDMSIAASTPVSYNARIAGVVFLHDVEAERKGQDYCACR